MDSEGSVPAPYKTHCKAKSRQSPHVQLLMGKDNMKEKKEYNTILKSNERRDWSGHVLT